MGTEELGWLVFTWKHQQAHIRAHTHTPAVRWSGGWVGCEQAACHHC